MARFDTSGIDQELMELGNVITQDDLAEACKAGAEVVKEAWKQVAE